MAKFFVGIKLDIEDEVTGAPIGFHTISSLAENYSSNTTTVGISSYFTQKAFNSNRQPVGQVQYITVSGTAPRGVDAQNHAYQTLVAVTEENADAIASTIAPNIFTGATLVERDIA